MSGRGRSGPVAVASPTGTLSGIAAVIVAALLLIGGNAIGRPALAAAVIVVQIGFLAAWVLLFEVTAEGALLAVVAVAVADALLLRTRSATAGSIAGVLGLSFVVLLWHQLARRDRRGVLGGVAVPFSAVAVATAIALLLPLRELAHGRSMVLTAVVTTAVALLAVRLPLGADPVRRVVALVLAVVVSLAFGLPHGGLSTGAGVSIALVGGAGALLADRILVRLAAHGSAGTVRLPAAVLGPVTALLPLALAAPLVYLAGRVIAGGGG